MQLIFLLVYFVIKLSNLCGTKNVLNSFFVSLFLITVVVFTLNFTDVVEHLKCYTNRIRVMGKHEAKGEKKKTSLFRPHDNSGKVIRLEEEKLPVAVTRLLSIPLSG